MRYDYTQMKSLYDVQLSEGELGSLIPIIAQAVEKYHSCYTIDVRITTTLTGFAYTALRSNEKVRSLNIPVLEIIFQSGLSKAIRFRAWRQIENFIIIEHAKLVEYTTEFPTQTSLEGAVASAKGAILRMNRVTDHLSSMHPACDAVMASFVAIAESLGEVQKDT